MSAYKALPLYICFTAIPLVSHASEFEWSELGLRIGIDAESRADVCSYELISTLESPWNWSPRESFRIDLNFEFGLGALDGEGETGFLAHAGPALEIEIGDFPLELVISSGPALLSEDEFDSLDLGGTLQLMSAIGFDFNVTDDWTLGYRYLHISNAGLHDKNPGMNLQALTLLFEF